MIETISRLASPKRRRNPGNNSRRQVHPPLLLPTSPAARSENKKALTRFASRRLGVPLALAFGKRGGASSTFQLFDFRAQSLNHSMLIKNDLNHLLAAERIKIVQNLTCPIWSVSASSFKPGYKQEPLINYLRTTGHFRFFRVEGHYTPS